MQICCKLWFALAFEWIAKVSPIAQYVMCICIALPPLLCSTTDKYLHQLTPLFPLDSAPGYPLQRDIRPGRVAAGQAPTNGTPTMPRPAPRKASEHVYANPQNAGPPRARTPPPPPRPVSRGNDNPEWHPDMICLKIQNGQYNYMLQAVVQKRLCHVTVRTGLRQLQARSTPGLPAMTGLSQSRTTNCLRQQPGLQGRGHDAPWETSPRGYLCRLSRLLLLGIGPRWSGVGISTRHTCRANRMLVGGKYRRGLFLRQEGLDLLNLR